MDNEVNETYSLEELDGLDFADETLVGPCPRCGEEETYDCETEPLILDICIGHCPACGTYWCLECGCVFDEVQAGVSCPHWAVCDTCSEEQGYLDTPTFVAEVCGACERNDSCSLEDLSTCVKEGKSVCPHEDNLVGCPRIRREVLGEKDSPN